MYAFGHIAFAMFFLFLYTKDLELTLWLAPLSLLPDIDLLFHIQHRSITHTPLFLPIFLLSTYIVANFILKRKLNWKALLVISVILFLSHLIPDIVCGTVNWFGIKFGIPCELDAKKDLLFGSIFYFLFLYYYSSRFRKIVN